MSQNNLLIDGFVCGVSETTTCVVTAGSEHI